MIARVTIMPKKDVLDPKESRSGALHSLGHNQVAEVRVGKVILVSSMIQSPKRKRASKSPPCASRCSRIPSSRTTRLNWRARMRWAVVTFPGSNCDEDCKDQLSRVLGQDVVSVASGSAAPRSGLRRPAGWILLWRLPARSIARFSPIMKAVVEFAQAGGLVLGICNGFQILLEVGLLPGAMQRNRDLAFICEDVHLTVENRNSAACGSVPVDQTVLRIPIAHMEGNYTVDDATLKAMEARGQVLFRYCSENGELGEAFNPNGSVSHIAGIQNEAGNVFGMMPHPERASEGILGGEDGAWIFRSLIAAKEMGK